MRVPDNYDLYEMYEREQARREKLCDEELPFGDEEIEVAFYIQEREEDIEILEKFLIEHGYNYEKEVL